MEYKSLTTTLQFHVKHCYICVLSSRTTEWQDNGRKIPFVSGKFQIYEQWANFSPAPFVETKQMKHVCRARIVWGRTETHVKAAERDFLLSVSSPHTHTRAHTHAHTHTHTHTHTHSHQTLLQNVTDFLWINRKSVAPQTRTHVRTVQAKILLNIQHEHANDQTQKLTLGEQHYFWKN
jgi:hypothetical protein